MATAGARFRGAGMIIGVESVPSRVQLSRFYGADQVVDPNGGDAVSEIIKLSGGEVWIARSRHSDLT